MTGTTTQIMIDIADLTHGLPADKAEAARARLTRMVASMVAFALGCTTAALLHARAGIYCFLMPPLLGIGTLMFRMAPFESAVHS
jgi:uncharacterized membrane protein YoaK (UPF0700 family)